ARSRHQGAGWWWSLRTSFGRNPGASLRLPVGSNKQVRTRPPRRNAEAYAFGWHWRTPAQPSADALKPRALRTRGSGRVLVLSASGVRTLMRDVPSIQDKVLAALTAR